MGFLHPSYLLAALVALVPLVIHLLHRQRVIIVDFPSLEFLRRLMRKKTRRFQLRQLLLLIMRILIMLLLALALARPTLTGGKVVRGHLPTAAAVVLDNSLSMLREYDGEQLFEIARRKAVEVLEYFDSSDEVHLMLTAGDSENRAYGARGLEDVRREVMKLHCSKLPGDMVSTIRKSLKIVASSSLPARELYVISDMQKADWDGLDENPQLVSNMKDLKVMLIDLGGETANACVKDITLRLPVGEDYVQMDVTLERYGGKGVAGRVVEAYLRDRLLDRRVFSPNDGSQETESFELPHIRGALWGEVSIAQDRLPIDDRRYFAYSSARRKIAVVGDSYYIKTALAPRGAGRFEVTEIEPGAINTENIADIDGLVISNVNRFAPLEVEAISDYIEGGGGVIIFLGDKTDVGAYNRKLLPIFGNVTIDNAQVGGAAGFYTIDKVAWEHPIFSKFKMGESPFEGANFFSFLKLVPAQARVIAWFSDGSPAVIEPRQGVLIFASSDDGFWNDFVATGQFVPLLHEALIYVSSQLTLKSSYLLGHEIAMRTRRVGGEVVLDGPTGQIRQFPEVIGQTQRYRIRVADEPGVYFLRTEDETLTVFAVNVDVRESDLARLQPDAYRDAFGDADLNVVSATDDIAEGISLLRQGRDLLKYVLWGLLILVIAESLIASNFMSLLRRSGIGNAREHS